MISHILLNIEEKMQTSIDLLKRELAAIRTGHATPALVEHIKVDYAGVPTPLMHLAGISAPAARLLVIQSWDRGIAVPNNPEISQHGSGRGYSLH